MTPPVCVDPKAQLIHGPVRARATRWPLARPHRRFAGSFWRSRGLPSIRNPSYRRLDLAAVRPRHRRLILAADRIARTRYLPLVRSTAPLLQSSCVVASGAMDASKQSKKLKDVEISFPIVYGTISFWLGKKASEYNSHKWTVYVRSATNEDLSVIVKRAVFQLHPSFHNPTRVVDQPPFELSESGWGEFEIAITLYFHSDVCEKRLDLFHQLKLYPEEEAGPQSTKKPVVVETYDEIVFPEPSEAFFQRVQNHPAAMVPRLPPGITLPPPGSMEIVPYEKKRGDTKDHPLSQWFKNFSEADELLKLAAARQQVQAHIAKLRRQLSMIEGMPQQSKALSVPGQQFGHI